jgi:hypothetical protein
MLHPRPQVTQDAVVPAPRFFERVGQERQVGKPAEAVKRLGDPLHHPTLELQPLRIPRHFSERRAIQLLQARFYLLVPPLARWAPRTQARQMPLDQPPGIVRAPRREQIVQQL